MVKHHKIKHHKIKPFIPMDHANNYHHAFLLESFQAAIVLTIYAMFNDMCDHYVTKNKMNTWHKYVLHTITMFISSLFTVYILLFIFGYGIKIEQ